ncbi:MAG: hypothetical protein KBG38_06945, partial [Candidatus Cloacimonas sp.]|jgi:hypothetical protein|nr:hypothetical protein [Candidatus Cloacimonas sp.]
MVIGSDIDSSGGAVKYFICFESRQFILELHFVYDFIEIDFFYSFFNSAITLATNDKTNPLDTYTTYISIQQCVITYPHRFFVGMPKSESANKNISRFLFSSLNTNRFFLTKNIIADTKILFCLRR